MILLLRRFTGPWFFLDSYPIGNGSSIGLQKGERMKNKTRASALSHLSTGNCSITQSSITIIKCLKMHTNYIKYFKQNIKALFNDINSTDHNWMYPLRSITKQTWLTCTLMYIKIEYPIVTGTSGFDWVIIS